MRQCQFSGKKLLIICVRVFSTTPTYPNIFTMNLNESKDYGNQICSNRLGGGRETGPAIISWKEWSLRSFSNFIIKHLWRNKKSWQFTVPCPGTRDKDWSIVRTSGKFLWMTKIREPKESAWLVSCVGSQPALPGIESREKQTTLQTSPPFPPCSWGIEPRT